MSLDNFRALKEKRDELVLAATDLAMVATPWGNDMPSQIVSSDGTLTPLPEGWQSFGEVAKDAGAEIAPERKFNDIFGYGSMATRRRIKDSEGVTINVTPQETRQMLLAMQHALSMADLTNGDGASGFRAKKYATGGEQYWSLLLVGFDGTAQKPIFPWWLFPKVSIGDGGKQSLKMDSPLASEMSFTAYEDHDGSIYEFGIGGAGWVELSQAAGFGGAAGAPVTVSITGGPTGGTFTLSYGGETTDTINYNTTAANIRSRLEALSSVGVGNVQVSGTTGGPWTVAFDASLSGTLTADASALTGGESPTVEVTG